MPLATNRRPIGNYARQTPDWFSQVAGTIGGFYWSTAPVATAIDLFNASSTGLYCHVYYIMVGNDAAGLYGITSMAGHGANLFGRARNVLAGGPAPEVNLYWDTFPAQYSGTEYPQDTPVFDDFFLDNEAGSEDLYRVNGPIKILPSGYSLRVYTFVGSGQTNGNVITASFHFVMLPDQG